jgi:hypothetical protein
MRPASPAGMITVSSAWSSWVHGRPLSSTARILTAPSTRSRKRVSACMPDGGRSTVAERSPRLARETIEKPTRPQRVGAARTRTVLPSRSHARGRPLSNYKCSASGASKTKSQRVMSAAVSCAGVQYGAASVRAGEPLLVRRGREVR